MTWHNAANGPKMTCLIHVPHVVRLWVARMNEHFLGLAEEVDHAAFIISAYPVGLVDVKTALGKCRVPLEEAIGPSFTWALDSVPRNNLTVAADWNDPSYHVSFGHVQLSSSSHFFPLVSRQFLIDSPSMLSPVEALLERPNRHPKCVRSTAAVHPLAACCFNSLLRKSCIHLGSVHPLFVVDFFSVPSR